MTLLFLSMESLENYSETENKMAECSCIGVNHFLHLFSFKVIPDTTIENK